eukprot:scpid69613/ scgid9494/ 
MLVLSHWKGCTASVTVCVLFPSARHTLPSRTSQDDSGCTVTIAWCMHPSILSSAAVAAPSCDHTARLEICRHNPPQMLIHMWLQVLCVFSLSSIIYALLSKEHYSRIMTNTSSFWTKDLFTKRFAMKYEFPDNFQQCPASELE